MAIQFKFRSSASFDSVDIDGRPSISVKDLKSKIVRNNHLNLSHDFRLLFSDAFSGLEYSDENGQIPSGSSVIIKRVPAGVVPPSATARVVLYEDVGVKCNNAVKISPPKNAGTNFDDFGAELCPLTEATISGGHHYMEKKICSGDKKTEVGLSRCLDTPLVGPQKLEASDLSDAIPRGPFHIGENTSQKQAMPSVEKHMEVEKRVHTANAQPTESAVLPSELKCSLCDTYFKKAVMIPCCQHSFCKKCIHLVLNEKGRCPKCLSSKCKVEHLLPNISLRQAIDHFLESQILTKASGNDFDRYASDGESGIQANEMSYTATIQQREAEVPHSPSSTGMGSNQIIGEPVSRRSASLMQKLKQGEKDQHHLVNLTRSTDDEFQGESHPMQANSTIKRKNVLLAAGAERSFMEAGRQKKGDRTCYMCGSPDHFVRDCPAASSPHPMLHTGYCFYHGPMPSYISPYWNGHMMPPHGTQFRPFVTPYCTSMVMPFNVNMVPPAAFSAASYMPPVFGGLAPYGGFTGVGGGVAPVGTSVKYGENHDCEKRQKLSNVNLRRKSLDDDDNDYDDSFNKRHHCKEAARSHERKSQRDTEENLKYSGNFFTQRSSRKHSHYGDSDSDAGRSNSEVAEMPGSPYWLDERQHQQHHRNSNECDNGKVCCASDSRGGHHKSNKEKDYKRKRVGPNTERGKQKHHSKSESGVEPSLHSDQKIQQMDSSLSPRHSRHNLRSLNDELTHERWQMVSRPDKDNEEYRHYCKRKKVR